MIRRFASVAAAALLGVLSVATLSLDAMAQSSKAPAFVEGTHYDVVADKASPKPEVVEFFSFYCPSCYRFEPLAARLEQRLGDEVMKKVHVDFLQAASPELQNALARAYLVAKSEKLGVQGAALIFQYLHQQHASFKTEQDILNLFLVNGFDEKALTQKFNSMPIMAAAANMKTQQDYWSQKNVLTGVPTIIVNGRYRINNQAITPEKFEEEFNALVDYLLAKR